MRRLRQQLSRGGAFRHTRCRLSQLYHPGLDERQGKRLLRISHLLLEAVCGLLLIVNQMTKGAMLIVILMLTVFIGALGASLVRGLDINCGCFSLSDTSRFSLVRALLQDVLMLFVAVWIFLLQLNWIHRPKTPESGSG